MTHFIRSKVDYTRVNRFGKKIYVNPWLMVRCLKGKGDVARFGWTVPRAAGNAVTRNKIKRWCRESVREVEGPPIGWDVNYIFIGSEKIYRSLSHEDFKNGFRKPLAQLG